MTLAVAYTRVSSAEQLREGFSIPAQRALLRDYAERLGLTIAAEFSDDETAKSTGRAGFARMLAHLAVHPDHVILVEKLDRLYRNEDDYFTLKKMRAVIHFVREGNVIAEGATSHEKLMQRIKLAIAQNYSDNLSEEVKKGMRRKCEDGGWPTWAPLGYLNVKDGSGRAIIIHDPAKAALVRDIYEAAAEGRSLRDLCTLADRIGLRGRRGTTITKPTMAYVLKNEAYTGEFEWSGKRYIGQYEPLITRELFDRVKIALAGGSRPKSQTHRFTYSGLVRCAACEGLLTGNIKKGRYVYYSCRGTHQCKRYFNENEFDAATVAALKSLSVDRAVSDWIVSDLTRWYDGKTTKASAREMVIRKRMTELSRLESAAYEEKLLGKVPEDTWRDRSARWREEEGDLRAELQMLRPSIEREEFLRRVRAPLELAQTAAAQYLRQNSVEKGRLLRTCCQNLIITDGSISIQMKSPFDVLAKVGSSPDWLTNLDPVRTAFVAFALAA